jgi:hypothetical protein
MEIRNSDIKKLLFFLIMSILCLFAYPSSFSKDSVSYNKGLSVGMNLSSMGLGISLSKSISRRIDVRLNGSYLDYLYDLSKQSTELQGNFGLRLGVVGGFLDFYVLRFLHLTGGVSYNLTKVSILGQLNKSISIGDILLEPEEIGKLEVTIAPGWKVSPYLGFGMNFRRRKHFNFGLEFGAFFQGPPSVTLNATGMLTPTASKDQELLMEKNISPLIYYPYISLRFSYHLKSGLR